MTSYVRVAALTDIETKNKYKVKNAAGQQIFFAGEESGFCTRQICGSRRGFTMHIVDNFGQVRATSCESAFANDATNSLSALVVQI